METRRRLVPLVYDATSITVPPDGKPKSTRRQIAGETIPLPAEAIYA
jgi:hypothetical protein